jgi:hypothetical protein
VSPAIFGRGARPLPKESAVFAAQPQAVNPDSFRETDSSPVPPGSSS